MAVREAIAEDLDYDPTFARQREIARFLLGITLNRLPQERPETRLFRRELEPTRQELIDVAIKTGLVWYDEWHHAPLCKANNWSKQMLPEGPCSCGAQFHKIK